MEQMERYAERRWFFVPTPHGPSDGVIVPTSPIDRAYDLGRKRNWELIMGKGWGWVLPWNAVRRGMDMRAVCQWRIAGGTEIWLLLNAERTIMAAAAEE
jgi:palmitoyltransferase